MEEVTNQKDFVIVAVQSKNEYALSESILDVVAVDEGKQTQNIFGKKTNTTCSISLNAASEGRKK